MSVETRSAFLGPFLFELNPLVSDAAGLTLLSLLKQPDVKHREGLPGRNCITRGELPNVGPVVVKHYRRGGLLSWFVSGLYLKWGVIRSKHEFEMLCKVREIGVHAPEPVGFGWRGRYCYRAWLITKEIPGLKTLAELSRESEDEVRDSIDELVRQISLMIEHKIFHIDLHPGNVLIGPDKTVYLLDFDKAEIVSGPKNALRDKYLCRWRRAVIKHELPELLSEMVSLGLRKSYED